jgi:hypothetical protein
MTPWLRSVAGPGGDAAYAMDRWCPAARGGGSAIEDLTHETHIINYHPMKTPPNPTARVTVATQLLMTTRRRPITGHMGCAGGGL